MNSLMRSDPKICCVRIARPIRPAQLVPKVLSIAPVEESGVYTERGRAAAVSVVETDFLGGHPLERGPLANVSLTCSVIFDLPWQYDCK